MPSRTIDAGGLPLPVCARDTGIYAGVFIGTAYIALRRRFRADRPPSPGQAVVLCLCMLPMILDGMSSYMGLRESGNTLRLVTGIFFGNTIPFLLIPAANFKVDGENRNRILHHWPELLILAGVDGAFCLLLLKTCLLPWVPVATAIMAALVFVVGRIAYTIVLRSRLASCKYRALLVVCITAGAFGMMLLASGFVFQPLKAVFLNG